MMSSIGPLLVHGTPQGSDRAGDACLSEEGFVPWEIREKPLPCTGSYSIFLHRYRCVAEFETFDTPNHRICFLYLY